MPRYFAKSFVSQPVLEAIVNGTHDTALSQEERDAVQAVPEDMRDWFEKSAVNGLYLPLRGALRQPKKTLLRLVEEFLPPGTEEAWQQGRTTTRRSLREKFERRRGAYLASSFLPKSATFEDNCAEAIRSYVERIMKIFAEEVTAGISVKYITVDDVIGALGHSLAK